MENCRRDVRLLEYHSASSVFAYRCAVVRVQSAYEAYDEADDRNANAKVSLLSNLEHRPAIAIPDSVIPFLAVNHAVFFF